MKNELIKLLKTKGEENPLISERQQFTLAKKKKRITADLFLGINEGQEEVAQHFSNAERKDLLIQYSISSKIIHLLNFLNYVHY